MTSDIENVFVLIALIFLFFAGIKKHKRGVIQFQSGSI